MRALMLLATLVGCGDNLEVDHAFAPASGARLKLEQYRYEDGTLQADTSVFYDTVQHTRCAAALWGDDQLRCVPDADEVRFTESECTTAVGLAREGEPRPTHFLGYDTVALQRRPSRLYRVGAATDAPASYYTLRDEECRGPFGAAGGDYYALTQDFDPNALVAFTDSELGAGRLGLQIRETADGLRVPLGTYDRELDLPCTPTSRADGVACEPTTAVASMEFLDAECTRPGIKVDVLDGVPAAASVIDPLGCTRYHAAGIEVAPQLYRREGSTCTRAPTPLAQRVFSLGAVLSLVPLEREVEAAADRRLQTITLSPAGDADLRFLGDRLVDAATHDECVRVTLGDVTWCLPAFTPRMITLFATGCTLPVRVVDVPARTCVPLTFAGAPSFEEDEGYELYAIGDRLTTPLYHFTPDGCVPYVAAAEHELRALGPRLPPDAFLRAVKYGERTP